MNDDKWKSLSDVKLVRIALLGKYYWYMEPRTTSAKYNTKIQ